MASTRNNNTPNDYNLQHRMNINTYKYKDNINSQYGLPYTQAFPAAGSAPPSRMSNFSLSYNPIAIESQLFGIGSTNLVNPTSYEQPRLKYLPTITYFERNNIIMPEPLTVNRNERVLLSNQ